MPRLYSILILFLLTAFSSCSIEASIISSFESGYEQGREDLKQTESLMHQIQTILAVGDSIFIGNDSANVTNETVKPLLINATLKTPWGTDIVISTPAKQTLSVTIPKTPESICQMFIKKFFVVAGGQNFSDISQCNQNGLTDIHFLWKSQARMPSR